MAKAIDNIKDIKASKPFKKGDIIVYAVIVILIVVLFIVFMNIKSKQDLESVSVYIDDIQMFEYNLDSDIYDIFDERISIEGFGDILKVRVNLDKGEYNIIQIDKANKRVNMLESSCKTGDCVKASDIKDGGGVIICLPHHVKIVANGNELTEEIVSG